MVALIYLFCALTVMTASSIIPDIGRMIGLLGMIFFSLILLGKNKRLFPLDTNGALHIFSSKVFEVISGVVFLIANAYAIFFVYTPL